MKKVLIEEYNKLFLRKKLDKKNYSSLDKVRCINYNKIIKRNYKIINFCSIFLFIFIYYLYYLSLEKCFGGLRICSRRTQWISEKLNEGLLCSILLSILFELIFQNVLSKMHLIHVIIVFISFIIYSHNLEFYDHGLFNFLGIIAIIIIANIFFLPFNILLYLIKKSHKIILFIYCIFLVFFLLYYKHFLANFIGCDDWAKGLNNTYIINDINKYDCMIRIPKYCPYKFMKYFLDFTQRLRIKCGNSLNNKKKILKFSKSKYINKLTKRIGFSTTNANSIWSQNYNQNKTISNILQENLFDMDKKELLENIETDKYPEIIIDFSENIKGKLKINLHFNKTLSMERKKIENEYKPYSNNIMILYFDSISRANGIRQFKKTLSFFEKFMSYNSKDFHSFQFLRYHSFKRNTYGNFPKLFIEPYNRKRKIFRITYYLKQYGYVTAFSNDMCFNYPYPNRLKDFSIKELCDHEFLLCDPNRRHINTMFKRCLYEKTNIEYQYEYGMQFWKKYKDNRKFLMIVNNDGHEGTLEAIKYDDDIVFNFLNNLYKENLLRETTIILLSDHGCPMPSVYYFNDFFQFEKHLPMLFILTSDKEHLNYTQQYYNIYENQQKFITAYDIYNTICYLMLGNNYFSTNNKKINYISKSKYGFSLFDSINHKRSPKNYHRMKKSVCI